MGVALGELGKVDGLAGPPGTHFMPPPVSAKSQEIDLSQGVSPRFMH